VDDLGGGAADGLVGHAAEAGVEAPRHHLRRVADRDDERRNGVGNFFPHITMLRSLMVVSPTAARI